MKLAEALLRLDEYVGRNFSSFVTPDELTDLRTNKGHVGQLIERLIGLSNTSKGLDFEDGELKTNKSSREGKPMETMFIAQIMTNIDQILAGDSFWESYYYKKIKNMVYFPICKEGNEADWMFLPYVHVNLEDPQYSVLKQQLFTDYERISEQLNHHIRNSLDKFIHTSNGQFIQIRSKDSKPYHPIFSQLYQREVSNKNHAFYFKKEFMLYLQNVSDKYPCTNMYN
jgi:DNA mismatch repair protein MutH